MNTKHIDLHGSRALVTGAAGFIGTHLCRRLTSEGMQVHGTYRRHRRSIGNPPHWWPIDLSDGVATERLLDAVNPDFVFHLASHVNGSRELSTVWPTFQDNLVTTVQLMSALAGRSVRRFVIAGSMGEPRETGPDAVPSSPYAAAKLAASIYARFFHQLYDLPVSIARIAMVYGPDQIDLAKLVPYVTLSLLRHQVPRLSSGVQQADWVYVDDVVDALIAIARHDRPGMEPLDVGTGVPTSVRGVVDLLQARAGGEILPAFGAVANRSREQHAVADVESTFERIGWRSRIPLHEGMERTLLWYRQHLSEIGLVSDP